LDLVFFTAGAEAEQFGYGSVEAAEGIRVIPFFVEIDLVVGFRQATVLTLATAGDSAAGARWKAHHQIDLDKEWYYPDSLGRLYGAVTELLGFRARGEEHKVQWLSASGDDRFAPLFRAIVSDAARLDASYFDGNRLAAGGFSRKFFEALAWPMEQQSLPSSRPQIARGLQKVVEKTVLHLAGDGENLCLAGGLFFNAMLVESLERSGRWKNVFVQAAAGNAGTALGRRLSCLAPLKKKPRHAAKSTLLLGPSYGLDEIKQVLENCKLDFSYLRSTDDVLETAVKMLSEHKIVAWMQGRMEFGPRALGNRSILASPLDPYSTENLNVFIKHREALPQISPPPSPPNSPANTSTQVETQQRSRQ